MREWGGVGVGGGGRQADICVLVCIAGHCAEVMNGCRTHCQHFLLQPSANGSPGRHFLWGGHSFVTEETWPVFSCTGAASLAHCWPVSKDHFVPLNYQPETETHTSAPTVAMTPVHENTKTFLLFTSAFTNIMVHAYLCLQQDSDS